MSLDYLHSLDICHRDLKPSNIFVKKLSNSNKILIVGDLGKSRPSFSKAIEEKDLTPNVGTPAYKAPELLNNEKDYNLKVDIWAAGVILYELLTHKHPFNNEVKAILCNDPEPLPPTISTET